MFCSKLQVFHFKYECNNSLKLIRSLNSMRLNMSGTKPKATSVFTSETIVFSDDGGWCWFESPGALQYGSLLLIG